MYMPDLGAKQIVEIGWEDSFFGTVLRTEVTN